MSKKTAMVSETLRQILPNECCLIRFAAVFKLFNGLLRRVIYVFSKNAKKWPSVQAVEENISEYTIFMENSVFGVIYWVLQVFLLEVIALLFIFWSLAFWCERLRIVVKVEKRLCSRREGWTLGKE